MIDIHADDYALTVNTSQEMLTLMKEGVFHSISIIVNTSCFEESITLLKETIPTLPFLPKMSVHLDLVEGLCLSENNGSLINEAWKDLFLASYIPVYRNRIKRSLKKEISAQLEKGWRSIKECLDIAKKSGISCDQQKMRIDSHQHTHMIPVVHEALVECLRENRYEAEYIRNSKEPLAPFLKTASLISTYRPVNIVKNRLLDVLSWRQDRYDKTHGHNPMYLWGLVMSGKMDAKRIEKLFPQMTERAQKDGRDLEILFHPGRMKGDETCPEIPQKTAEDFYLSEGRNIEKEGSRTCRRIADAINN